LKNLPENTVLAGWPDWEFEKVVYVARRVPWVTVKTHQAFHVGYLREMRRRLTLLIEALFSADLQAIDNLRLAGVTHLLIRSQLYGTTERPRYFEPFDGYLQSHWEKWRSQPAALSKVASVSAVYRDNDWILIRLKPAEGPHGATPGAGPDPARDRLFGSPDNGH
ncbi:MAG: hypothetical protein ACLP9L_20865, partial [Thermoguttaceae bacterium]